MEEMEERLVAGLKRIGKIALPVGLAVLRPIFLIVKTFVKWFLPLITTRPLACFLRSIRHPVRCFKENKIKWLVLLALVGWVLGTGLVFVPPHTVRVIREPGWDSPGAPRALINESDSTRAYMTWPWIPWTGCGVKEESYSLEELQEINVKIPLFYLSQITGNPADGDIIVYLKVSGTAEIRDWQRFVVVFDTSTSTKPEVREMSRLELAGRWVSLNLFSAVNDWFSEFQLRAYQAYNWAREYDLQTAEEIEEFIKTNRAWYWALGVFYINYVQELVDIDPSLYGIFVDVIEAKEVEKYLILAKWKLGLVESQIEAFYEEMNPEVVARAELIISEFKQYLEAQGRSFPVGTVKKELSEFLVQQMIEGKTYSPEELYIARVLVNLEAKQIWATRLVETYEVYAAFLSDRFKSLGSYYSEANISLWRAAIQEVMEAEGEFPRPGLTDFYPWLKEGGMKQLEEDARLYQSALEKNYGIKFELTFEIIEEEVPTE